MTETRPYGSKRGLMAEMKAYDQNKDLWSKQGQYRLKVHSRTLDKNAAEILSKLKSSRSRKTKKKVFLSDFLTMVFHDQHIIVTNKFP